MNSLVGRFFYFRIGYKVFNDIILKIELFKILRILLYFFCLKSLLCNY